MPRFTKEQQEAIDIEGSNVLISAGAGSGKTEVLSQRVLRKIKNGISIDNLLVLTFTNAAAAEMKDRIRDKIGQEGNLKEEFDKVEASYIVTFDAFTLAIVKKYHYLKDLSNDINVVDASIMNLKKTEILDTLFNTLYENKDEDFLDLIKTYCFKNDKEIKEFVNDSQKEIDLFYNKNEFLNDFETNFYNEDTFDMFKEKYQNIVLEFLKNISNLYHNISLCDLEYSSKLDISELIESKTYEEVYEKFTNKLPSLPKNSEEELKFAKDSLKEGLDKLGKYLSKPKLDDYIDDYKKTKKYTATLIRIIKKYDLLIEEFKRENNLFEFLDIAKLSIDILCENEEVRLYYKERFNEILIDEYQDTSDLQEIFINLIQNNNVYMVGDIKQSIYRFRNANPDIFKMKFNNYGKNIGGRRVVLNKNFRSRNEVLDNINLIFNYLMDDKIGGANYKSEHKLEFGNTTYSNEGKTKHSNDFEVRCYEIDKESEYTKEEIEIFTMANDIQEKMNCNYKVFDKYTQSLRNITYNDFAILIDKSKNFELIKKIFNHLNIAVDIVKEESIKDSINIKIIKNIIILVNNTKLGIYDKKFSYAYTSIARSYLFKLDDEDIFDTLNSKKYYETIIYEKIKKISENLNEKNIYDVLSEIIEEFDIYNKIITIGDIDNNIAVIEYLLDICEKNSTYFSIEEFIDYLDNITYGDLDIKYSLSKGASDSVKVMTIHKSKGLEYPVVYFPFLQDKFNRRDIKKKIVFNKKYGIIMPVKNEDLELVFTKELLKNDFLLDDISEKLRLFYVALTRAKEKIIFIMNFENKKDYQIIDGVINDYERLKYSSFKDVLESVNKVLIEYAYKIDIDKINLTKEYDLIKKSNYLNKIPKTNDKITAINKNFNSEILENKHFSKTANSLFTEKEKINIKEGLNIHYILENIDFNNINYEELDEKYKIIVKNFIDTNILVNSLNIYKEYEFIYQKENLNMHGIIDLLIEKENEFIIIDYKLNNITNAAYLEQLNGYKEYIEGITNKETKIYLYSIIQNKLINLEEID